LTSAGFFSEATEFRQKYDPVKHRDRVEQIPHAVADLPPGESNR